MNIRRHFLSRSLFGALVAISTGSLVLAALPGCNRPAGDGEDPVVMIEAMCEGDLEKDILLLHVRHGECWRVELALPRLSKVWIAAGTESRVRWHAGDPLAPDVGRIASFARFFEKLLAATSEGGRKSGAASAQREEDGKTRISATEGDPVAWRDHATGLPTRLVGSVAFTNYYWVCALSDEEMKRAFADTNSYLRKVVADGRLLEHAPTNLAVFLARQKQGLHGMESRNREPLKARTHDK